MTLTDDWLATLIAVAAALTALGVIWRTAVKPIVVAVQSIAKKVDRLEALAEKAPVLDELPRRMDRLEGRFGVLEVSIASLKASVEAIDKRTKTLEPNGGSSMSDTVARIDQNTDPEKGNLT